MNKTIETNNPYGYTGREVDAEDLYYYRARYYDPTIQRFISEDPIGFASGDFNFYRYVGDDPVDLVDPTGEFWNFIIGAGLSAGLDLFIQLANNGWNIHCVNWYSVGASAALGALGVRWGGAAGKGKEFSHWIPRRHLPDWLKKKKSPWLGNYVSPRRHFKHDNYRYPRGWRDMGSRYPRLIQQIDRIPNAIKGIGAGGALGTLNSNCECN